MPRMRPAWSTLLSCCLALASVLNTESFAQTARSETEVSAPHSTDPEGNDQGFIRLGVGDLLEISVYGVPELSTKARVGSNGSIYLPLIDYVHVGGLTPEQAQGLIEKRLADGNFVNDPHVSVVVSEYPSQAVSVLGQVARPGTYPLVGERRLYDLISAAGGLAERAGKTVIITHRDKPDQPVKVTLGNLLSNPAKDNVIVQPGDTVVVQRAGVVYVVGDVARPSGLLMENDHLTVLQALALAGGANKTAKLNGTKILHQTQTGVVETPIPLKNILRAKQSDVPLHADDILFIPGSAGKAAAYRAADVLMQAGGLSLMTLRP